MNPRPDPRRDQPPPWCDSGTLAWHLCISEGTVTNWVTDRILPPGRKRGGKLMWAWNEVDDWLRNGPQNADADAVRILNAGKAIRAGKEGAGNGRH